MRRLAELGNRVSSSSHLPAPPVEGEVAGDLQVPLGAEVGMQEHEPAIRRILRHRVAQEQHSAASIAAVTSSLSAICQQKAQCVKSSHTG